MWGKVMIPMYRLRLHCLYGLYGPRCPLSPERPLKFNHSLTPSGLFQWHWHDHMYVPVPLTHWGRVTHICVNKLTIICSLAPSKRQAIIWTSAGILLIWLTGTNFNEILIEIYTFSFNKKYILKWRLENGDHFVSASRICLKWSTLNLKVLMI